MKKILLLGVCSLFALNNAQAGKFKEIPINEKEVYLQYDDDEERRGYGFTIEIGKIDRLLQELDNIVQIVSKKEHKIVGIDFSNSDLGNEKFEKIDSFIKYKYDKNINSKTFYNLNETDVDLFEDEVFLFTKSSKSKNYEEETEDNSEMTQKTPYQGFKCEVLRSVKIPLSQIKSFYEDSDEDM